MNLSAPLRPLVRETFRAAPNRWLPLALIEPLFNALPEAKARTVSHGSIDPAHVIEALKWNVERGYLESRENAETEATEYRLTDAGRRDLGA